MTTAEIFEMEKRLKGIKASISGVTTLKTPEQIYAHYRTLRGGERSAFYDKHANALWAYYKATI